MIFALTDYVQYRFQFGRYGDNQPDAAMGALAFKGEVPPTVIAELEKADVVFTQRTNSVWSWGTMYFGSSSVDHMATYVGDGDIIHMTLGGVRVHSLNALARNARVLIVKEPESVLGGIHELTADEERDEYGVPKGRARWFHVLPPKAQLAVVAAEISLGYYPDKFRWKFYGDFLILCVIADALLYAWLGLIVALPVALIAGVIIFRNLVVTARRRKAGTKLRLLSHPDLGYRSFFKHGGPMVTNMGTLVFGDFGVLPWKVFVALTEQLGLDGEGTDDGSDNQLEEPNQFVRNGPEHSDAGGMLGEAKYQEGQQDDDQ